MPLGQNRKLDETVRNGGLRLQTKHLLVSSGVNNPS